MSDKNVIRMSRITSPGADDKQFPTQQMEYLGKVADGITVFPYGFHANVTADVLALMFSVQGMPENRFAMPFNTKKRPKLAAGEVAFFHPPTNSFIIGRANGDLDIETGNGGTGNVNINCRQANITASESVTLDTPETTLTGNVTIDQNLTVTGDTTLSSTVTSGGKDISDTHTHVGSATAPTGPQVNTGVVV